MPKKVNPGVRAKIVRYLKHNPTGHSAQEISRTEYYLDTYFPKLKNL
jgi:hypothetical protein